MTSTGSTGSLDDIARRLDREFAAWRLSLTYGEVAELRAYQGVGYLRVNPVLRDEIAASDYDEGARLRLEMTIDTLDSAISKGHLQSALVVYRGLGNPGLVLGTDDLASLAGQEFPEDAFASTSLDPDVALRMTTLAPDRLLIRLGLADGQSAAWLPLAGNPGRRDELEVLLPRGLRIKVETVGKFGDVPMIEATVVA